MDSLARRGRTTARWAWQHFRLVAGIALVVGLTLTLAANRDALAAVDWTIEPFALAGAIALLAAAPLAQALTLRIALRRLGAAAPPVAMLRIWARSFALRYEPSGAVGFVYRVRERERLGATTPQVLTATGYEQLAAVTAGALVAVAAFAAAGGRPPLVALLLAGALAAAAIASRPALLGDRIARWAARRGVTVAGPMRGRTLALLIAINAVGWAATAAGATLLADGLLGPVAPDAFTLLGAFALSSVVGALMPLLPAGLGPRDAALTLALTPVIGPGAATVLALALRVVSFAGELLAIAVAELAALVLSRRERAVAATATVPAPPRTAPAVAPPTPARSSSSRRTTSASRCRCSSSASPRPAWTCSSSTTARPTAPASSPTRSPPNGRGCTSCTAPRRTASAWPTARASPGVCSATTRSSARWTAISPTRPRSSPRCAPCCSSATPASCSARATCPAAGPTAGARPASRSAAIGCSASRLALGLPFSDLSGGFKLWRAETLAAIDMDELLSAGYAFQVETTQLAHLAGARIEEVPFVFSERVAGASKMTLRISLEGIRVTLALRRHHRPARDHGLLGAL